MACISTSSFSWLNNSPWFVYIQHSLFIRSSVDSHLDCFYLLAIVKHVIWIFVYKFVYGRVFSLLLDIHPGVELLGHVVTPCLTTWETSSLFSTAAAPRSLLTSSVWRFILPHPSQHLLLLVLLIMVVLVGVKWYLVMILTCISLMINGVEHLFLFIGHFYIIFEKCLFKSYAHFLAGFFVFLFWEL